MHPNALMLVVVLLGNLMLPFIWAQNGKKTDVTVCVHIEGKCLDLCEDCRVKCFLREFGISALKLLI